MQINTLKAKIVAARFIGDDMGDDATLENLFSLLDMLIAAVLIIMIFSAVRKAHASIRST